jgi:hypothetical protein
MGFFDKTPSEKSPGELNYERGRSDSGRQEGQDTVEDFFHTAIGWLTPSYSEGWEKGKEDRD